MIQLHNVNKTYSSRYPALSDITLDIGKGEFVLIVGPSGAGKTTLLKLMFLSETPSQGHVIINGTDTRRIAGPQIPFLRRKIGFVFQDFKLLSHWTVYDNVAISLEVLMMERRLIKRRVQQILKHVGLLNRADATPLILSGGEQQRVAIARAIVKDPLILLADEPTGNLDLDITRDIMKLFKIINSWGTTVVIATHNKALLEYHPTKVIALKKGAIQDVFVSSRMVNPENSGFPSRGE